jgi:hypothetical protein
MHSNRDGLDQGKVLDDDLIALFQGNLGFPA